MIKSKYLEAFQKLQAEHPESFELIGDCILVEGLPEEEAKTASGLIISSTSRQADGFLQNRPAFYQVLLVGRGYYSKDEETGEETTVPLNVQAGDIVLMGSQSVRRFSQFGPIIAGETVLGLAREEEISMRFKGGAGYEQVCLTLLSNISNIK